MSRILPASEVAKVNARRKTIINKFKTLRLTQKALAEAASNQTKYKFYPEAICKFFNGTLPVTSRTVVLCDIAEQMISDEEYKLNSVG